MASSLQEILLTGSPDGPITAYDSSSGATLAHFNGSRSPRKGLALVGKKLIGASHVSSDTGTGSIHLYNWWSSTAFYRLPVPEPVAPLAATLDGLYLYAGGISGHIHALSINSGNLIQSVDAHCKPVSCLEINSDGSLLLSGSDDGTIAVYPMYQLLDASSSHKTSSHSVLQRFVGHDSPVTAITTGIGRCNCTIISSSLDCTCKFWSLRQGFPLRTLTFTCAILGVVMDPIESAFYAAGSDGSIYVGALVVARRQLVEHGKEFIKWGQKHGGPVIAISMVKEGQILISASEDGSIWFWQVGTGQVIKVLGEKNRSISELVVAKGFDEFGTRIVGFGGGNNADFNRWNPGFSIEELRKPVRELMDMKQQLNVAVTDRSRTIAALESEIGIYEKLLELILKEVNAESNNDNTNEEQNDLII